MGTRGEGEGSASTELAQASAGAYSGPLAAQLLLRIQSRALGGDQLSSKEQQLRTSRLPSGLVLAAVPREALCKHRKRLSTEHAQAPAVSPGPVNG